MNNVEIDSIKPEETKIPSRIFSQEIKVNDSMQQAKEIIDDKLVDEYYDRISEKFSALDTKGQNHQETDRLKKLIKDNLFLHKTLIEQRQDLDKLNPTDSNYKNIIRSYNTNEANFDLSIIKQFLRSQDKETTDKLNSRNTDFKLYNEHINKI